MNKKVKVLHYIVSLGFGGIERLAYDLVVQQKENKELDVNIGVGKLKGEFKEQFQSINVPLIDFNLNSGFDINPFKILNILRELKKMNIIHLHGFHLSIIIAAILSGRKIVYTEHGNFGFGRVHRFSDKLSFWFRKMFIKYSSVSICCNSNFTREYLNNFFYKSSRTKTIYNGIAFNKTINSNIVKQLQKDYSNKFIVGTTSRLAGFKRIDRLIDTFNLFLEYNENAILMIVGDGPEKERLIDQVITLNIKDKVVFKGYQEEVTSYQSFFDVCVFPSKQEPFGLVAVECLKLQKPVLVFKDGGGICEIIDQFNINDVCSNQSQMVKRMLYYQNNNYQWNEKNSDKLKYFYADRMENDYFNEYKNIL